MRYAAENPDVAAALGQDAAALYLHYADNGVQEGRNGYSTDDLANTYLKLYEVFSQITNDTIPSASYTVYGAMGRGLAVCEGYAKTFKMFMDVQGIECEEVDGMAEGGSHAWNRVKLDGEYYYIDVTWDDPDDPDEPGRIRYDYYLTKDSTMGGTHLSNEDEVALWRED